MSEYGTRRGNEIGLDLQQFTIWWLCHGQWRERADGLHSLTAFKTGALRTLTGLGMGLKRCLEEVIEC